MLPANDITTKSLHECATQRAIVRWLNTAGSGWGLRESNRSRYWVPTDAVEHRCEVGLRRRDAFSEPLGRRSSKFEKASACVSEHSGKLWSSPFHRMPCICACRTCPFRNIARTKRHVAPSRTWDMSCLPSPRCSLPPLLAFRNLYYRSGNPQACELAHTTVSCTGNPSVSPYR